MALRQSERQRLRRRFTAMAGEAFDAMFDEDQQEQLITLTQREDRVLGKSAEDRAGGGRVGEGTMAALRAVARVGVGRGHT